MFSITYKFIVLPAITAIFLLITGSIDISTIPHLPFADEDTNDKNNKYDVKNGEFSSIPKSIITLDSKKYRIEVDYVVEDHDEGIELNHNEDVKSTKTITLREGEDVSISLRCNYEDCETIEDVIVYLVDKNISEKRLLLSLLNIK